MIQQQQQQTSEIFTRNQLGKFDIVYLKHRVRRCTVNDNKYVGKVFFETRQPSLEQYERRPSYLHTASL